LAEYGFYFNRAILNDGSQSPDIAQVLMRRRSGADDGMPAMNAC
jgi:hypothetical protein